MALATCGHLLPPKLELAASEVVLWLRGAGRELESRSVEHQHVLTETRAFRYLFVPSSGS